MVNLTQQAYQLENDEKSEFFVAKEVFDLESVEGMKSKMQKRDGVLLPAFCRNMKVIKEFELKSDDTFVIGYPKSGTTWVEEIVWLLQNNLDFQTAEEDFHFLRVYFIDRFSKVTLSNLKSPRVFKSHLLPQFLPENVEKRAKVVYVMRNPKDMLVSAFNFFKSVKDVQFVGSFETLVNNFTEGKFVYGEWWRHLDEYLNKPEVHIVKYEELLENPIENIKKLCLFLGKNYSDSDIAKIVSFTSFDKMKKNPSFSLDFLINRGLFDKNIDFFKKGQIGNWKNHFTDELSKKVDECVKKT